MRLRHALFKGLIEQRQRALGPLARRDVDAHLEDHGGTVLVGEGNVVGINHAAIRASDLPMVGLAGLHHAMGLAELARLAPPTTFIAASAVGIAELFAEAAVGKDNMIVRRQQADCCRQRFQHGKEPPPFGFRRCRRLAPRLAFAHCLLGLLAGCDVLDHGQGAQRLAGGIANDGHVHVHPRHSAVLAKIAFLVAIFGLLAADHALEQLPVELPVVRVSNVDDAEIEHLLGGIAGDRAHSLVHAQEPPGLRVGLPNAHARRLEDRAKLLLALPQFRRAPGELRCSSVSLS